MFIRTIFLLLAIALVSIYSAKVHDIVKNVGKRFLDDANLRAYADPQARTGKYDPQCFRNPMCKLQLYTDDQIRNLKLESALLALKMLLGAASSQNKFYNQSLITLESILEPDMTADICEGELSKKMNSYEYLKHVIKTAALFYETPKIDWRYHISDTPRDTLRVQTVIVQWDKKFNTTAQTHYDVTLKYRPHLRQKGTWFAISHVYQGGICPENGALVYKNDDSIDVVIDNIEDLKNHPTARTLLNFFTPLAYQFFDPEQRNVPSFWIRGLVHEKSILSVCHDELKESKPYTVAEFETWYRRLQVMWHPKKDENNEDEEFTSMIIEKIEENKIIAMVTLKLQMGLSEQVLNWNFRVSAVRDPEDPKPEWYIGTLDVPCNLDYNYKDESFAAIRDVIGTAFVEELVALPDPTLWYSTIQFANQFMKHGTRTFEYCDHRKTTANVTAFEYFVFQRNVLHIKKFTKYWIDHRGIKKPAPDTATVSFRTISIGVRGEKKTEYENVWKFDIRWDEMEQFYYVEEMIITCHHKQIDGKYEKGIEYIDIDYGYGG
ncbi:unnamed protein product [Caenorhabditis brenneri]